MDTGVFQAEFRKRVLRSKSSIAEVTNEVTLQILFAWQKLIPKANRAEIEALGITYRTTAKSGKLLKRKKAIYSPTTAFKLIALKALWRNGPSPRSFGNAGELDEAIRRKLALRSSSVGFVASGPVPAIRALLRKVQGKGSWGQSRSYPGTKGKGIPASEESWSPFAEIENATGMNGPHQTEASKTKIEAMLTSTWQRALAAVVEEWADYVAKQIEKALHAE